MNVSANSKNGPNGITLSLCFFNNINDVGKAMRLPIKIANVPSSGSSINPKTNIIFISPPPRLSFFNVLLPMIIIKYIIPNRNNPDNICFNAPSNPKFNI